MRYSKGYFDSNPETAVHCNTQEEYNAIICKYGLSMNNGWASYNDAVCIYVKDKLYSSLDFARENGYTIIEASDVLDEFVLPEKWCIKKDHQEICDYFMNNNLGIGSFTLGSRNNEFIHNVMIDKISIFSTPQAEYTEITFEQFKKYVLKKTTMNKTIIGYKVPVDMFISSTKQAKGTIYVKAKSDFYQPQLNCPSKDFWLPSELVETWEPVYEEEKIQFGKYTAEFKASSVKFGCKEITLDELKTIRQTLIIKNRLNGDSAFQWTIEGVEVKFNISLLDKIIAKLIA